MKFAHIDSNGFPVAFYTEDVHGTAIPPDAVELTDAQWQECIDNSGHRKIAIASDGTVTVEPYAPPLPPASERRTSVKADIDRAAGRARARFVSPGDLVDQEYLSAESAAQAFKDAGYPSTDVPSEVQAWTDATGMIATEAADDILITADAWRRALANIRGLRLQGKASVDAAADTDIETVAAAVMADLDAVQPV